eukprot:scaffold22507_cov100-Skeletonema_marinoi.AAC.1
MVLSSASSRGRFITTLNPTESRWYQYFNTGLAARMGDVVRQDLAYTLGLGVLLELLSMFEDEWRSMRCDMPIEHLSAC